MTLAEKPRTADTQEYITGYSIDLQERIIRSHSRLLVFLAVGLEEPEARQKALAEARKFYVTNKWVIVPVSDYEFAKKTTPSLTASQSDFSEQRALEIFEWDVQIGQSNHAPTLAYNTWVDEDTLLEELKEWSDKHGLDIDPTVRALLT